MSSMTFGQKSFTPSPPDKGSFPLDHEGLCKRPMLKYMLCLTQNNNRNSECRQEAKDYLECRMENNLMAKEDFKKLAFDIRMTKKNVLLMCTGSVASLKVPEISKALLSTGMFCIRVVVTEKAKHFFDLKDLPPGVDSFSDDLEWSSWEKRGDPVLHIELRKWADIGLVAPLDANTLGKVAAGIADNLVTCCLRAWDFSRPLLVCPAMNTQMWLHPVTSSNLRILESWGFRVIQCIEKTLVCGDTGLGAMAEIHEIVAKAVEAMKSE
ncbi:unnamed protein product [Notodromas monacha]|uniref:Phosphopantothenoylcysteine decarboxylase n=1 Tax=Notodromas monacha TaxID=399045 RepID=A0A7R9GG83_9CRUS|nr:unnamed protein product [Notodromas monacha]CAG0920109.1 unnamed protein product [Notodromas monacha]